ncbi:universal stress protein [Halodesulfurarchaeum sp. HSR-GB]|uniref:universal stress protein n=1 Tax=Halodesulfurarchaeum sp. HSR-GB TaxID=3074077 RepID=UPI00285FC832|nr:universal stress protein [Halodesulfurarchaeum sp. HSR-GB]MDR5657010.1 universal stress protein [Halodesulfurarchaeum sp. HSR-GB]
MYDRIVVAVDSSAEAAHAARTGFALAQTLSVPVDVVTVLEASILDALRSGTGRDRLRSEREQLLADIESRAGAVSISTTLLEGRPADRIVEFALDSGTNPLVVLGRQGRSSVSRRLLGGVTEGVLERGDLPVLVDPGPGEAESDFDPSRILVPTDGSENADVALPHVAALANQFDAAVTVLSVVDLQRAGGVFNAGGLDAEFIEALESRAETATAAAEETIQATESSLSVESMVRRSKDFEGVSGAICETTVAENVDLVVMGSHGRSNVRRQLLGSVTSTVLRSIDVPTLVVPRSRS